VHRARQRFSAVIARRAAIATATPAPSRNGFTLFGGEASC